MAVKTVVSLSGVPPESGRGLHPRAVVDHTLPTGGTSGTAVLRATDDEAKDTEILTVTATGPGPEGSRRRRQSSCGPDNGRGTVGRGESGRPMLHGGGVVERAILQERREADEPK